MNEFPPRAALAAETNYSIWDAALDSSEVAAVVFDPRENWIFRFNEAMIELTEYPGHHLMRKRASDLFDGKMPQLMMITQECLHKGTGWSDDLSIKTKSGLSRDVEVFGSSLQFGGDELILLWCQDRQVTRKRRAKVEIERQHREDPSQWKEVEATFRDLERGDHLILNAAGEGIYGVNAKGEATFLNPAAERMLGWRAEELVGRQAHQYMHHTHTDGSDYLPHDCPIYAAFRDGVVQRVDNDVFWCKDGTSIPVEYTSTPIQENGRLLGAVVVFRDVSKRRESEERLQHALKEVETLKRKLEKENEYLNSQIREEANYDEIVGNSAAVQKIIQQVELVAPTDASVVITGESGTGKELIARAIHERSERSNRPMIKVNCAVIPRELFESEFFGHTKGAFTGATSERAGRFELADGGTIFLDEITEIPFELQGKLLRVLQEGQFERVGDTQTYQGDFRVIAATNLDLKAEMREKRFREDLYFRLNVFPIDSVPLRERLEDIPLLATHFIDTACKRLNKPVLPLSLADLERLQAYHWPGNIRELQNVIEHSVIVSGSGKLRFDFSVPAQSKSARSAPAAADTAGIIPDHEIKDRDKANIVRALEACHGRVSGDNGAAKLLQMKPATLYSRLKSHGIDARRFK